MKFVSFHNELGLAALLFARPFSNIQIERINDRGESSWLHVPCVNAQRSRIIKALENQDRKAQYRLPLIAFSRTGLSRVTDRLSNPNNEVKYEITSSWRNLNLLTPVPVDISYDVVVMAKYQADIDRIASNFMVFFNNDIYVSCEHPLYSGLKMHNQIVMGDNVSEDHPDELDASRDDIITSTFSFTFKTFLFGGTTQAKLNKGRQVSSYISSVLSDVVFRFDTHEQLEEYLSANPVNSVSATRQELVDTEVTSYIESGPDLYDDGIPVINSLDFGFYAVPTKEDIAEYVASVDNEVFGEHKHVYPDSYISSLSYEQVSGTYYDDEGNLCCKLSSLVPVGDFYAPVDGYCSYAPFVDRVRWEIDTDSLKNFPDNFKARGEIDPVK